jgi:hypothetical protein
VVTVALTIAAARAATAGVLANGPVLVVCGEAVAGSNEYESRMTGTFRCVAFVLLPVFAGAALCAIGLALGMTGAGWSLGA